MPKMDFKRLGKHAAGDPAELMVSVLTGNNSGLIALPGSSPRDGLVSVLRAAAGSAVADITSTASIVPGGSLSPGMDIDNAVLTVFWYRFS